MQTKWSQFKRIRWALPVILSLLILGPVQTVWGHAYVDATFPQSDKEIDVIPYAVCIRYTEPIEKAFSAIVVKDAEGNRVDDEEKQKKDTDRFGVSDVIYIPLMAIQPGTYTVEWKILSIDTHVTENVFTFTVAEGAKPMPQEDQSPCGELLTMEG